MSLTIALNRLIFGSVAVGATSWLLSQALFVVPGGHRAVIYSRNGGIILGVVKEEGMNWIIPFWQSPQIFDVRITPQTIRTETPTKGPLRISIRNNIEILLLSVLIFRFTKSEHCIACTL